MATCLTGYQASHFYSFCVNYVDVGFIVLCDIKSCVGMQEVGSYRPAVRPDRRRAMQREIMASAPQALQVLASCLNHKGEQLCECLVYLVQVSSQTRNAAASYEQLSLVALALLSQHQLAHHHT